MKKKKNCADCRWWRYQSGSAHALCFSRMDFSFSWGAKLCKFFAPEKEDESISRDGVNQFMAWTTYGDKRLPTRKQAEEYLEKHSQEKLKCK